MITSITSLILGLFNGALGVFGKFIDYVKEIRFINYGREQQLSDLAKEEIEINRKQTEILTQERTKEEVIKRMENGDF
jgi:hypothetical protein